MSLDRIIIWIMAVGVLIGGLDRFYFQLPLNLDDFYHFSLCLTPYVNLIIIIN